MSDYNPNASIVSSLKEGVYRYAYPSYRVYVFGQDITADVVEVRVNQSGGSAERTPGGCSITLVNPNDNYILTFYDMMKIGEAKEVFKAYAQEKIKEYQDEYAAKILNRTSKFQYEKLLDDSSIDPDSFTYDNLKTSYIEDVDSIKKANDDLKKRIEMEFVYDWYSNVPGAVKARVLQEKLSSTYIYSEIEKDTNLLTYESGEIGDYPIQQGDCIFHSNDPVRIAFRDPYDPRSWYWVFAGFVDTFTENTGENLESYITITCTDVTKMMRYSLLQLSTGVLDPNIEDVVSGFEQAAEAGFVPYQELFAGFTIYEVMETLFFGAESTDKVLYETTMNQIANMSDDEKKVFLMSKANLTQIDADDLLSAPESANSKISEILFTSKSKRLASLKFPPVTVPAPYFQPKGDDAGVIKFSRKDDNQGVYVYYYGDPDNADKALGEQIKDLRYWNKEIHHLVTVDDLDKMRYKGEAAVSNSSSFTIAQVIEEIGTHPKKYPVGAGKVYYFAPARLSGDLGRNLIDKSLGGAASMHSEFKDRLSYVYDLASNIDFRFYATPRGDIVFEMPFYDFDPEDFFGPEEIPETDEKVKQLNEKYETLIGEAYNGNYQGIANELTQLRVELNASENDFDWVDFSKPPEYDFRRAYVIEEHEQYSYSVTSTDEGVLTAYRSVPSTAAGYSSVFDPNLHKYQWAYNKDHIRSLGLRVGTGNTWGFIDSVEGAELYSALMLRRVNSEARNMSLNITPNFGLMCNRPVFWRKRNYAANIVSLQHSISWGSSCETSINLNQIRGWTGKIENGKPYREHFMGRQPFDLAKILKQGQKGGSGSK